jgi:hypothetical protein
MNDETQLDRQQLETATSRSLPAGAPLDGETSALRDGFMSLGRALEGAAADFDEAALIARVQSACRRDSAVDVPSRNMARYWPLLLSGALAASALVAVLRIVANWPTANDAFVGAPQSPTQTNEQPQDSRPQFADDGPSAPNSSTSALAWDDPLDEEIAAAEVGLADLSGRLIGIDGALSNMNQTLEALSDDLSAGSL